MSGSESQGQEEAACKPIFSPTARMLLLHMINGYDHVMASGRDAMLVTMDTVCGTSQAKLHTKVLSSGCSFCVLFGLNLLMPCEFQCLTRKASARNWKMKIRYLDQPLSHFVESYTDADGEIVGLYVRVLYNPPMCLNQH